MYRLLIVDDERDVADALCDRFCSLKSLELDVYKAYSSQEALEVLDARKIDIVMTDVRMPGMGGLQLLDRVRERWPDCPVIFLTGYSEFETIYAASRQGNVTYLLKTESLQTIAAAVEQAAARLDERLNSEALLQKAHQQMRDWLPVMKEACLRGLLQGEGSAAIGEQFHSLGIALDPQEPVLLVAARLPGARLAATESSRRELMIRTLAADCFSAQVRWAMVSGDRHSLFWLLQPAPGGADWQQLRTQVRGSVEALQTACASGLGVALTFAVDGNPAAWEELPGRADALVQLLRRHFGRGGQLMILDGAAQPPLAAGYRALFRKVRALEECMEDGRKADYERLEAEIAGSVGEETAAFFRALAQEAFVALPAEDASSAQAVVARVCRYIAAHLEEDLSLVRLADMVYFNPSYLSRVFKQITGENVIERINGARVARARELLAGTRLKIKEISQRVGYENASYFTQFFRRETGLSPQEYRDSCHAEPQSQGDGSGV